jgi:hypothetical protein
VESFSGGACTVNATAIGYVQSALISCGVFPPSYRSVRIGGCVRWPDGRFQRTWCNATAGFAWQQGFSDSGCTHSLNDPVSYPLGVCVTGDMLAPGPMMLTCLSAAASLHVGLAIVVGVLVTALMAVLG